MPAKFKTISCDKVKNGAPLRNNNTKLQWRSLAHAFCTQTAHQTPDHRFTVLKHDALDLHNMMHLLYINYIPTHCFKPSMCTVMSVSVCTMVNSMRAEMLRSTAEKKRLSPVT